MALYIGPGTIEGGSNAFTIKNAAGDKLFERGVALSGGNTFAFENNSNVPVFIAGSASEPGWINFATNAWGKVNNYATTTSINRGNHYSTVNTRFTAPISGPYFFTWNTYCYSSDYVHPQFAVNGGVSTRRYDTPYRIRGYGMAANYQQDAQIEEVINLVAGDYVEAYMYAGGTAYHYAFYGLFTGMYVG